MQADPLLLEFAKSRPDEFALELSGGWLESLLVYTVAATTLASGAAYVVKWGLRAVRYEGD